MTDAPLLIQVEDPAFAAVMKAAEELFRLSLAMGMAEEGSENGQAAHFAMTALLNAAALDEDMTTKVLGAICGTSAAAFSSPDTVLGGMIDSADFFLRDAVQRRSITYAQPKGNA